MEGDNSDDDLPPVFNWRHTEAEAAPKSRKRGERGGGIKYSEEDLVWVKYRSSFWPAVVCRLFPREKKMKVMFVDAPNEKNMLKVPFSRAIKYLSPKSKTMKFEAQRVDGCSPADKLALNEAIEKVEQFLCKRALGGNGISPRKFFMRPYCYAGKNVDYSESSDDDCDLRDESRTPMTDDGGDGQDEPEPLTPSLVDDRSGSGVDELSDGKEFSNSYPRPCLDEASLGKEMLDKSQRELSEANQLKDLAAKLLAAIQTEECDDFLKNLYDNKVRSRRHRVFTSGSTSIRRGLKFETGFGPFIDDSQQEMLLKHLLQTFKQHVGVVEHMDVHGYLFEVLVPEAIMWALCKVLFISRTKAEKLMRHGGGFCLTAHKVTAVV